MQLFKYINLVYPEFDHTKSKIHLARYNGTENPLNVYRFGQFDNWQKYQNKKNFEKKFVVSLIQSGRRWLFAGLYINNGRSNYNHNSSINYVYDLLPVKETEEYSGRLYVSSAYKGRTSYLLGETLSDDLNIVEIKPMKLGFKEFKSYKETSLTRYELERIIELNINSWVTALKSVKGIYVLTDTKTGKLYIGKADGINGIWQRWNEYYQSGHGGNLGLVDLFKEKTRMHDITFTILEVLDINSSADDFYARESYWKNVLGSRIDGYNLN
ncbi:GIY-YIG nuclease family protein [Klebsiella aerogenes]|uniref:GIY-YIG nuclease family protein n=1 Tax=Klebsiella aerogenes TaxID=548 RepID=UPI0040440191